MTMYGVTMQFVILQFNYGIVFWVRYIDLDSRYILLGGLFFCVGIWEPGNQVLRYNTSILQFLSGLKYIHVVLRLHDCLIIFNFSLYPAYSNLGRENPLRHSVTIHFPPNSRHSLTHILLSN